MAAPAKPTRKPSPDLGAVFEGFDSYNSNIVETTVLMDGPGVLFGLVVNTAQSGATCSIFDASTLQGGIAIPNVNRKGSILLANQGTIAYEAKMTRGLLIQTNQGVGGIPADVTFIFKQKPFAPLGTDLGAADGTALPWQDGALPDATGG